MPYRPTLTVKGTTLSEPSSRPLVIYHADCFDGFSAAWCFWRKYGRGADYLPGVYQQDPPVVDDRDVFLVDFSYRSAVVAGMLQRAASVTLIDHHKTALADLEPLRCLDLLGPCLGWFCDMGKSGATLAWDFLFPDEERPPLLNHVEDRDLWLFRLPRTREILNSLLSYEYTFENWDRLMAADQAELSKMAVEGEAIERKRRKDLAEIVRVCKRHMVIGGHTVSALNLPRTFGREDADNLMVEGGKFVAYYYDTDTVRNFSLRSSESGLDVSEIAAQYGGGGHARAAGFRVPRTHPLACA